MYACAYISAPASSNSGGVTSGQVGARPDASGLYFCRVRLHLFPLWSEVTNHTRRNQ